VTCYVDDVQHKFGSMIMCHLWADSLEELLAMVDKIGVQRRWIQGHPELSIGRAKNASWLHFDIAASKKRLAIENGAVLTDKYGPLEHEAKRLIASGDPKHIEIGRRKLERVLAARAV
jgi:hypothetical protein